MTFHTRLAALSLAITAIMIAHITVDPRKATKGYLELE